MRPVICFGEALIDFLNTSEQADGCLSLKNYRQYPGGAPANAAVAVAKLGGQAYFSGQVGDDIFGHFLEQALLKYNVNISYLYKHPTASTALAFVTLDEDGDRSFSFYRQQTADMLFDHTQINADWFEHPVIFHFCSNTLTEPTIANTTKLAVKMAKENNALVSFDVNLRHNLWQKGSAEPSIVNELIYQSDIIKFSKEEFDFLAKAQPEKYVATCFNSGISLIVITNGEHDIEFITHQGTGKFAVPKVEALDTTAGGDAFSGALLMAFSHLSKPESAFDSFTTLEAMIRFASFCGAHAVTKQGAFPALPTFKDVEQYWPVNVLGQPTQANPLGESHAIF